MNIVLVCMASNEDHYIDEWIEYHKKLGISKIIIYQHNWKYTGKYKQEDFIELYECNAKRNNKLQVNTYNNFIQDNYNNYDWAGFIDIDEFICLKNTNNISDFLNNYNDYYAVGLNWNIFGGNGLEFNGDYSLVKRFIKCNKQLNKHIKCFINFNKAKNTLNFDWNPHNIEQIDKTISVDKSHFINGPFNTIDLNKRDIAYINHYYVKTKYEWDLKIARGWPCRLNAKEDEKNKLYTEHNTQECNEYLDLTAYNFFYNK